MRIFNVMLKWTEGPIKGRSTVIEIEANDADDAEQIGLGCLGDFTLEDGTIGSMPLPNDAVVIP